jgi:GT2 family glycosyltransferase
MWLAGYKVFYVSSSKVYHWGGTALWKVPDSALNYYKNRNQLWTLLKNLQLRNVILYYPLTLFFITVISLQHKRSEMVSSAMRAISYTLLSLKTVWIKRLSVQMLRKRSDREMKRFGIIETSGSIVKTSFLFSSAGKRTMKSIIEKIQDAAGNTTSGI